PLDDHAVVDERLDQLFDIEGVPIGAIDDEIPKGGGDLGDMLQKLADQSAAGKLGERLELDALVKALPLAPLRATFVETRSRHAEDEQRQARVVSNQVVDEVQGSVVRPMDVLDVDHDRVHPRSGGEELTQVVLGHPTEGITILQRRLHLRPVGEIEADELPDEMRFPLGSLPQEFRNAFDELL